MQQSVIVKLNAKKTYVSNSRRHLFKRTLNDCSRRRLLMSDMDINIKDICALKVPNVD